MGTSSCLKIIACGGSSSSSDTSVDNPPPQAKGSNDKRGWSFRKRSSSKHAVPSNTASSETTTPFADKHIPPSDFHSPVKSSFPAHDKPHLPKLVDKVVEEVSASSESDPPPKETDQLVASENDSTPTSAPLTISQVVVASDSDSNSAPTDAQLPNAAPLPEEDSNAQSAVSRTVAESEAMSTLEGSKLVERDATVDVSGTASESAVSTVESNTSVELEISDAIDTLRDGDHAFAYVMVDDPAAIIIQTAVRAFLAQRGFVQLKSVIKLQAVIRGYLVRRDAVETLHCIQGIAKVQALVRARSSKSMDQNYKLNDAQFSTVKLLQNSFARQLLDSTPKPKHVNIRCDPLSPSTAWSWLERWMSVPKPEVSQIGEHTAEGPTMALSDSCHSNISVVEGKNSLETEANHFIPAAITIDSQQSHPPMDEIINEHVAVIKVDALASEISDSETEPTVLVDKSGAKVQKSLPPVDGIVYEDVAVVKVDALASEKYDSETEPAGHVNKSDAEVQESHTPMDGIVNEDVAVVKVDALAIGISDSETEPIGLVHNSAAESQQPMLSTQQLASEELSCDGKKLSCASRKANNPAFLAAQSKFEDLTSAANSDVANCSSHQEVEAETPLDSATSLEEKVSKTNEPGSVEVPLSVDPRIHVAGSECGTELSVSSTLDSPDRCELVSTQAQHEVKVLDISHGSEIIEGEDCETNGISRQNISDLPPDPTQQEEVHAFNGISVSPVVAAGASPQEKENSGFDASDLQTEVAHKSSVMDEDSFIVHKDELIGHDVQLHDSSATGYQAYKSSPEATPKRQVTAPESQGTLSSQVSVKVKRNKNDKSGSNKKRSTISPVKKSPSNPNVDSGARSSIEHLPKDQSSGKRRSSFGSTKSDNTDQEPRDSSSQISLPSYMQATESAKAKANSPKSSPDVHDKDVYSKKRHSLPGAGGRQGSPRIQRSPSQAAQSAKTNGSHPSNERKWQR